jgi:EAL domain-containing protein (putative c-di-GMP-specific phosphodiesterase class I)
MSRSYSYAFQPIVDVSTRAIFSYEALIRGATGESAIEVFARVSAQRLTAFDRESRIVALDTAGRLGLKCRLNLNALPSSIDGDQSDLATLLAVADRWRVPTSRLILEVTETEAIVDHTHFARAVGEYHSAGMQVAIDDFGAGFSGLNLLAELQPDMIKLDMNLLRDIESRSPRQSIVRAIITVCNDLGIDVVAEGVETIDEYEWLENEGVRLFQGYLFARPAFECLPAAEYPS